MFKSDNQLSTDEFQALNEATIFYSNNQEILFIKGIKDNKIELTLDNTLEQNIFKKQNLDAQTLANGIPISNLRTGL